MEKLEKEILMGMILILLGDRFKTMMNKKDLYFLDFSDVGTRLKYYFAFSKPFNASFFSWICESNSAK